MHIKAFITGTLHRDITAIMFGKDRVFHKGSSLNRWCCFDFQIFLFWKTAADKGSERADGDRKGKMESNVPDF